MTGHSPKVTAACVWPKAKEALAANALLQNNSKMVGRVWRNEVLRKQRKNGLAVAIDGTGVVVGCAMFSVKRDGIAAISKIAVAKASARRGIGSALCNFVRDHVGAQGAAAIELKCTAENPANEFYAKVGFEKYGEDPGNKRPLFLWRMQLTAADVKPPKEVERIRSTKGQSNGHARMTTDAWAAMINASWGKQVPAIIETGKLLCEAKKALGHSPSPLVTLPEKSNVVLA